MPRTARPVNVVTNAGLSAPALFTTADAANGETIPLDGNPMLLEVKWVSGAAGTVTLNIAQKVDGQTVAPKTVTVPVTTGDMVIKLGPIGIYQQADQSQWIDYSGGVMSACAYKIVPP
jgi:hypothetical protein